MDYQTFSAALDSEFTGEEVVLTLKEVSKLNSFRDKDQQEPGFSLLFHTESSDLQQGLYQLDHQQMGNISLFLVPISDDKHGQQLEAIFN